MALFMLISTIWAMLSPVAIGVIISARIEDDKEGFKAASLASIVVLLVLTFLQTITWFLAKGVFL